ncbi:hypothetical protein B0H12DRAFT_218789 [Mycena haematopus]|nr:hypothetical protein B0H12DRAFT_218789 [Mycena haematopus]
MDTSSRCSNCGALSTAELMDVPDVFPAPGTRNHTLLTTNEPPEDSESTSTIRSVISKTAARLASLEDEIYKTKQKLKHLKDERTSLSSHHAQHKAILSPLRRMPPELLSEIFLSTLPSVRETWETRKHYMDHSSWVLSHVSSRWRMVSLSIPSLWSTIAIDYSDPSITYSAAPIEAKLQRAHKLKIHFYSHKTADSYPQIQMFRLLSEHSARWEEFNLEFISELLPLLAALRNRVPLIEEIVALRGRSRKPDSSPVHRLLPVRSFSGGLWQPVLYTVSPPLPPAHPMSTGWPVAQASRYIKPDPKPRRSSSSD